MAILAELEIQGPDGKPVPVFIGVHECFGIRLSFCRSINGVERKGFRRPAKDKPEDEWTVEESIWSHVQRALKEGYRLVGIGRAEEGETAEEALAAVLDYEQVING